MNYVITIFFARNDKLDAFSNLLLLSLDSQFVPVKICNFLSDHPIIYIQLVVNIWKYTRSFCLWCRPFTRNSSFLSFDLRLFVLSSQFGHIFSSRLFPWFQFQLPRLSENASCISMSRVARYRFGFAVGFPSTPLAYF